MHSTFTSGKKEWMVSNVMTSMESDKTRTPYRRKVQTTLRPDAVDSFFLHEHAKLIETEPHTPAAIRGCFAVGNERTCCLQLKSVQVVFMGP